MRKPFNQLVKLFTSLRLTVGLLFLGLVLVFIGTIAQVDEGLYNAQARYFKSFFVYWGPTGSSWKLPVFPGGYFVGTFLLLNLLAAHAKRFQFTRKKFGILLVHLGIVLLIVGQLLTDLLSRESHMRLHENSPKNFTEDPMRYELAIINASDPQFDDVVVIPESLLRAKAPLVLPKIPFKITVQNYYPNSAEIRDLPAGHAPAPKDQPPLASGQLTFASLPLTHKSDDKNIPTARIEVSDDKQTLGTFTTTGWYAEEPLVRWLQQKFGAGISVSAPTITHGGHTYRLELRPIRYYRPYNVELIKFTHEKYQGTEIPKNFASRIRLTDAQNQEDREVLIYMNNPLRYRGETFYQGSFDRVDPHISILQVVKNPSWLTPYFSCVLVAAGLITQFMSHLIPFVRGRRNA
jgi:hypothetical protein